ncbi:MAG TPA: phytanoyl-CoA dioxygenase family protein [Acidimicrobiia bacterium]
MDGTMSTLTATATVDDVLATLASDGYAVVEGLLGRDDTTRVRDELSRILADVPTGRNAFEGYRTKRIYAIFAKTRALDSAATHPLVLGVLERVLGEHFLLSGPTGIEIGPGEVAQILHHDDAIYPLTQPHPELVTNVMWALDDFTEANGATRIVPGSHAGALRDVGPEAATVAAEMPAGSAMIYLGSVWHGGGANRTDRARLGVAIEYIAGWLRPQETHLLAVPPDTVRTLSPRLQELLGYDVYPPFVGYVDGRHPRRVLDS